MSLISEGYDRGFTADCTWYCLCVFQHKVRKDLTTRKFLKILPRLTSSDNTPNKLFRKYLLTLFAPSAVTAFTASKALDGDS
jgi:hypothetical protein